MKITPIGVSSGMPDLIPNLLPSRHVVLLAGDPFAGKTRFLMQASVNLVMGVPLFGIPTHPLKILYCSERTQEKMDEQAITMHLDTLHNHPSFRLLNLGDMEDKDEHIFEQDPLRVVGEIASSYKPDLVCFDTMHHFLPAEINVGTNDYRGMGRAMRRFQSWCRKYNVTLVIVHHLNKEKHNSKFTSEIYRPSGSVAITGGTASTWILNKTQEDLQGRIHYSLSVHIHCRPRPQPIYLRDNPQGQFEIDPDMQPGMNNHDRLLAILETSCPIERPQLISSASSSLGLSPKTVSNLLSKLVREKRVTQEDGKLTLSPA